MSVAVIRGWCPGALRPMQSGDGLIVRLRPHLGRLTQTQASGIADLAIAHGSGLIDLSSRANVQIRGVGRKTYKPMIDGLTALGLIDRDLLAETRRNVVLTPFWQTDDATYQIATALSEALTAPDAPGLPGKFGFAVDCGPAPVLRETPADIRIERSAAGNLICLADGTSHGAAVTPGDAAQHATTLARWFLSSGGAQNGRGRMRQHLTNGVSLPAAFTKEPLSPQTNWNAAPGRTTTGFLAALEFGQIPATALATLAEIGPIRVTPWRMLLIEGADTIPALPGLITDPGDPLLNVIACLGAPSCSQGLAATRPLARALAPHLPHGQLLHVSGCAKGCAHPSPAPITLVATGSSKFDLVTGGGVSDTPARTGLSAAQLTAEPDLLCTS